jgi:hypothetical protein
MTAVLKMTLILEFGKDKIPQMAVEQLYVCTVTEGFFIV